MIALIKTLPLLLCLAPQAAPALGGAAPAPGSAPPSGRATSLFSGIIDMKLTMESGNGDLRLFVDGGRNAKLDMKVTVNPLPAPLVMSFLFRVDSPKKVFLLNEKEKTYGEIVLDGQNPAVAPGARGAYKVKVLGKGKVLGYDCTHVTLTRDKDWVDAWISKDVGDLFWVLKRLQEANPQIGEAEMFKALEDAGQQGMPMRYTVIREGQRVSTEVRKIEAKALPASLFTIPRDYAKTEGGPGDLQPTPEQVEEMKKLIQGALQGQ